MLNFIYSDLVFEIYKNLQFWIADLRILALYKELVLQAVDFGSEGPGPFHFIWMNPIF